MLLKGRFEVLESLSPRARLARDLRTGRQVVVKELVLRELGSWESLEQLEREAAALATVRHRAVPALIASFALDEESPDPRFFLVREHLEGRPLSSFLGQRSTRERLEGWARALLGTLCELHGLAPPLVHGDLSPERVLERPDGTLALLGFGIAARSGYHAPEREGEPPTVRADLYSTGLILWSLATGRGPEELDHQGGAPILDESLPPALGRLLSRLLCLDARDRPRSAEEALALLDGTTALAPAPPTALAAPRRPLPKKTLGVLALGAILELTLAFSWPGAAVIVLPPLLGLLYLALRSERGALEGEPGEDE